MIYEVAIIGAGPAGISSAVTCKSLNINHILIDEAEHIGGLIKNAYKKELYDNVVKMAVSKDIFHFIGKVTEIKKTSNIYSLVLNNRELKAKKIILATGTRAKQLAHTGLNVFYDLVSIKKTYSELNNRIVHIIGGGEAAFDYALSMSELGANVRIVLRSNKEHGDTKVFSDVKNRNIAISYNVNIDRYLEQVHDDIILVSIGRVPNIDCIKTDFDIAKESNIIIIGDAKHGALGHANIAISDGIEAVKSICV